jgi:hypothetical protein
MLPKIPASRAVERLGINASQSFFEKCSCVFQEVAQQNDYGKDAYVDIGSELQLSPLCVALQIKSGISYRTANGDYFISIGQHAKVWRESTVPVFGIVYDPDDRLLRWVDLTGYLRLHPLVEQGRVPISHRAVLNESTLNREFRRAVATYGPSGGGSLAMKLLSDQPEVQGEAVLDAWALGRGDARVLLLMRRLLVHLDVEPTRRLIWALSHATPHPDIFWTPHNWIPEDVTRVVQKSFRWSVQEICHLFLAISDEEWGRGTLGQSLHLLLSQDPFLGPSLLSAVSELLQRSELRRAVLVVWIVLASSPDPRGELERLILGEPVLLGDEWLCEIRAGLAEYNEFSIYS